MDKNAIKYCKFCKYAIPTDAPVCAHCGGDQRNISLLWRADFNLGVAATIIMSFAILWQVSILNKQTDSLAIQTDLLKKEADTLTFQTELLKRQADSLAFQTELSKIEDRPYLYADILPVFNFDDAGKFWVGACLKYNNIGKFAASNIDTEVKIGSNLSYSNKDLKDIAEWYKTVKHSYPYIRNIFTNQNVPPQTYAPNIGSISSNIPKLIFIAVRICYKGFTEDEYFYSADFIYTIDDPGKGVYALLQYDTEWDMNKTDTKMPPINWEKYKTVYQELYPEPQIAQKQVVLEQ